MNIVSVTEAYKALIHSFMEYGTLCRLYTEDEYGNYLSGDKYDRPCHNDEDYTYYTPQTTHYVVAHIPFSFEDDKKRGPATRLADFAKESKEKKLRAFSLYKSLKEVLAKHGIGGNGIGTIRQFPPKTYPLKDDDEELQQCVKEIKRRLGNMGTCR
ncbi:hypothetical protein GLOIN_2v1844962 [Rhizophagus irregularis DAOM 181602=DAOM 197198]|uniref:Uncharacterized protein n=1 Tax=Rhizophagus irregularis (strain DAOM 181602 / DAOM 197198 / MUCL 43194) TaxID=747089 RepID=A0A2P4PHZ7_RHIID|nr:hypothetical protein GLOIN_2v1844962 [Rhizophagus irregularis DAOM 181602=DAOM 197198]POG65026.1 hypothetical protein GLOIN_2v1844962 [Rhizophagus irregularis DAOM 181602=DAOM 197198]|eukprot:XP_025171892.1 hypothetical protein GLOIN_2v1844962 [Rhizophagus irregularis DAOM 181602=DAOM 197198]